MYLVSMAPHFHRAHVGEPKTTERDAPSLEVYRCIESVRRVRIANPIFRGIHRFEDTRKIPSTLSKSVNGLGDELRKLSNGSEQTGKLKGWMDGKSIFFGCTIVT